MSHVHDSSHLILNASVVYDLDHPDLHAALKSFEIQTLGHLMIFLF